MYYTLCLMYSNFFSDILTYAISELSELTDSNCGTFARHLHADKIALHRDEFSHAPQSPRAGMYRYRQISAIFTG